MSKFNSLSRKLALLSLPLFMVGWAFYVAGFISELNTRTTFIGASKTISILFPYYVILIGGPFIIKLGLLHAVLSGLASSVCSAILSMLSTAYFTSVGASTIMCTAIVTKGTLDDSPDSKFANIKLMLTGLLLQGLSWCLILAFSTFHEYELDSNERTTNLSESQCMFTPRIAQNVNIICQILAMMCWCMFSIGLYCTSGWSPDPDENYASIYTSQQHPFFVSVTLILINLATLLQVGSTNKKTICISILSLMYFYVLGDKINGILIILHECSNYDYYQCSPEYKYALKLTLSGGITSIFFWGCSFAVWPFHRKHLPRQNRAWWK